MKSAKISRFLKTLAFFPYIGWLLPLYLLKDDEKAQEYGKTALLLSISVTILLVVLTFIRFLVPAKFQLVLFVVSWISYVASVAYLIFSLVAMIFAFAGIKVKLPLISDTASSFNI